MDEQHLETWMTFLKQILDRNIGDDLESPTSERLTIESRQRNIFWLNKKQAARVIDKFMFKYSDPRFERAENKGIANVYQNNYAIPFLETFLKIIIRQREKFVHVKLYYFSLRYVFRALKYQSLAQ
mmetsp:Transcript_15121/g.12839  ORF Transcript_15121/g.12839 Transcript_15121/m.12839 type:complete len:126 (+) Transcript_15121:710-1087(+)